ncbi:MAG: phage Gp37/Gp68 family protein [Bauldia sp.]|nr:phage Gp37/Gp68 family protein [Bauldia sp.]
MADRTAIEWTDATWPIVQGCDPVTHGCTHCYVPSILWRHAHNPDPKISTPVVGLAEKHKGKVRFTGKVALREDRLDWPLRWRRSRRIFVPSHGDPFHKAVPDSFIAEIYAVMICAVHANGHTFQVLTKRSDRARTLLADEGFWDEVDAFVAGIIAERVDPLHRRSDDLRATVDRYGPDNPPPGIWLGVSIEDQATADARIPLLLDTPAAVRFVSAEPLLGPIDFGRMGSIGLVGGFPTAKDIEGIDALAGRRYRYNVVRAGGRHRAPSYSHGWNYAGDCNRLDWIIVGGESGPNARPMHPAWARSIRDQCQADDVAFFFKQWGAWAPVRELGESDGLYHPAPASDPDAMRRCRHASLVMHADGAIFDRIKAGGYHTSTAGAFAAGTGAMTMFDVGKAAAGRLLDGREWSEFPAPRPPSNSPLAGGREAAATTPLPLQGGGSRRGS